MLEIPSNVSSPAEYGMFSRLVLLRRRELLLAVSLLGIVLSLFVGWLFSQRERQLIKMQFAADAEDRVQALKSAFADRLASMKFAAAFYTGSEEVERHEFRSFMGSILSEKADIEFFAWAPSVLGNQRGEFEETMRKDGFADCEVREFGDGGALHAAARRDVYYPVMFVEGHEGWRHLAGFDLAGDASCRAVVENVIANKTPMLVRCLVPGPDGKPVRKLCLFEYAHAAPTAADESILSRRLNAGVLISAIQLRMMLEDAVETLPHLGVNMYLYEELPGGKYSLLLARPSRIEKGVLPTLEAPPEPPHDLACCLSLAPVPECSWKVYCVPVDTYAAANRSWEPLSAVGVGFLLTAVLVGYLYLLTGRTEKVEALAKQRTEAWRAAEQRFRRLIDGAGDAFFLHDRQGRIIDVNKRACECLGYSHDELTRMSVRDIDVQPHTVADDEMPWDLPDAMYPLTFEGLHRRKNGETFPVEIRLAYQDDSGKRWFLALVRDITERKQAEAALKAEQRLLRQLLELLETDRKLVAYEIHDGLAQQLSGLSLCLQVMQARAESSNGAATELLPKAIELTRDAIRETRSLIAGLRPPILDESGVVAAIEFLVGEKRQTESARIEFNHDVGSQQLARPLESALFRIAQECLTNACRYSQSEKIEIDLKQFDRTLELKVQDWGVGFDPQKVNGDHFGLRGIRERARLLGGRAEIVSAQDAGTTVTVQLPLVERTVEEQHADGD
jgi:PAS domain S-box-containing protein